MWSPPSNLAAFDLDYYLVTVKRQSDMSMVVRTRVIDVNTTLALPQNDDYVAEITAVNECGQNSPLPGNFSFTIGE